MHQNREKKVIVAVLFIWKKNRFSVKSFKICVKKFKIKWIFGDAHKITLVIFVINLKLRVLI